MDQNIHDEIMKEFRKQLTASFTRGVVAGLKLGANYVAEKLKTPEDWIKLESSELIELLSEGVAMNDMIQNGKLGIPDKIEETDPLKEFNLEETESRETEEVTEATEVTEETDSTYGSNE